MEPKTPRSETHRDTPLGDDASSAAAASVVATLATSPRETHSRQPAGGIRSLDVNLPFQTPVRRTAVFEPSGATDGAYCRSGGGGGGSSSSSSSRDGAIRESSEKVCAGKGGDEGFQTPSLKEVSCAICLSPLVKLSGEKLEVYTIQLCRVSVVCIIVQAGKGALWLLLFVHIIWNRTPNTYRHESIPGIMFSSLLTALYQVRA